MRDNQPSATALMIAESVVLLGRDRETSDLVSSEALHWSERFVKTTAGVAALARLGSPLWRRVWDLRERLSAPGIRLHYLVRKQFIEDSVREAIRDGAQQVVVLAAGFDTLAIRLTSEFPHVFFFEIDHPATQGIKLETLRRFGATCPNLHFSAVDFSKKEPGSYLSEVNGLDRAKKTLFIVEGISMYLDRNQIDRLLRAIYAFQASRLILTFLEPQRNGRIEFKKWTWIASLWLWWKREPFRWGIPSGLIDEFLGREGFKVVKVSSPEHFRVHYLGEARAQCLALAEGEHVVVADAVTEDGLV